MTGQQIEVDFGVVRQRAGTGQRSDGRREAGGGAALDAAQRPSIDIGDVAHTRALIAEVDMSATGAMVGDAESPMTASAAIGR